jgi:aspartyl protease
VLHYRANGSLVSVPVRMNGSHSLAFVLDTGAPRTIVDSTAARSLGLRVVGEERGTGAGHGTYRQAHTSPIDFGLGAVVLHVPEPWVIDLAHVGTRERPDGLVGADLFEGYVIRIDPEARTLTFFDAASFQYQGRGSMLPLTNANHRLYVDAKLTLPNGIRATHALRIDTGSEDAASDNLVRQSTERRVARQGVGLGAAYVDTSGLFESVALGPYTLQHVWGASNDRPALGMEILRRFTMTFDVPHGRLYLEPNRHFNDPVPAPPQ